MKKIIGLLSLALITFACEDSDKVIDDILDTVENGVAIRTISQGGEFNFYAQDTSIYNLTFEAHDLENGGLMQNVELYVSSDGGTTEALFATYLPADFTTGPSGLPRKDLAISLQEVGDVISFGGGSTIRFRFVYNLTDGRSYTNDSVTGTMTGSYFTSPFIYSVLVGCFVTDGSAVPGIYTFNMTDSYADGWQGSMFKVTVDGVDTYYGIPSPYTAEVDSNLLLEPYTGDGLSGTATLTIPEGASSMTFEFIEGRYSGETNYVITYTALDGVSDAQDAYGGGGYGQGGVKILSVCK